MASEHHRVECRCAECVEPSDRLSTDDLPELTDTERKAMESLDMTPVFGTMEERHKKAIEFAKRYFRECTKLRAENGNLKLRVGDLQRDLILLEEHDAGEHEKIKVQGDMAKLRGENQKLRAENERLEAAKLSLWNEAQQYIGFLNEFQEACGTDSWLAALNKTKELADKLAAAEKRVEELENGLRSICALDHFRKDEAVWIAVNALTPEGSET